ncbi:MAG: UDP-N-acetylmuramate--L-alanine ligase [Bdellovibrionota bacterium]
MSLSKHIHFIGICGSGMSPLAILAAKKGYRVSGSDHSSSQVKINLKNTGIHIYDDHLESNVNDAQYVVYSSAISPNNPELIAAKNKGLQILHRSDFLYLLMEDSDSVVISGTHGKTTTSAMIAHMLQELGIGPSYAIGGILERNQSSAELGNSKIFVAEADESDGTFLKYQPYIGLITNIALDHLDFYENQQNVETAFLNFARNIKKDGSLVIGWDNPLCRSLVQNLKEDDEHPFEAAILSYGFIFGCDTRCLNFSQNETGLYFEAMIERDRIKCRIPTYGKVNISNALAALTVARSLELDVSHAAEALGTFTGVKRRLNILFSDTNFLLVDDYAHNPDKIAAAISALKTAQTKNRLYVIFQPHRYSRFSSLFEHFIKSFSEADQVFVLPIYAAGEEEISGFDPHYIANSIKEASNIDAKGFSNFSECFSDIINEVTPHTTILTVGAGDIWILAEELRKGLQTWQRRS